MNIGAPVNLKACKPRACSPDLLGRVNLLDMDALSAFMPMHMVVAMDGRILRAGPTLRKLRPEGGLIGGMFFDLFEMRRPRGVTDIEALPAQDGGRVSIVFRDGVRTHFKALAAKLSCGRGILVNLSFGISVVDAVEAYDLSSRDFAATDLAVEMLYLFEAKSAAMSESKKLNQRLQGAKVAAEEQAFTDTLTGLKNRRALGHVLDRLEATGVPFGLMQVDLDYFKQVNDRFGHAAGDEVLQVVARVLVSETRECDTVARVGGDEFVLVFQRLVDTELLQTIARRIISRLEEPVPYEGNACRISCSIGIATSESHPGVGSETLLEEADKALYASKHAGRGRCMLARPEAGSVPDG
ncbi:GGDEF domain-containing protein [Tropicimonas sediminicola]|uniref:Diguanylate cyclase (GGDEF) domain-containing protein n=1 Tax=Tropicimonas sediminicola TaxID=1031541 RepID=A0A239EW27_9RHOB|nr:diguanylate cyclase [Tropicimonas sediminicola]SNS48488.1 diguanylate cyclase (GGDEF) domain-containing protein [Tropicimonas sediminicola]